MPLQTGLKSFIISSFTGLSEFEDRGIPGAFKFTSGADVRKPLKSLSCQQALTDDFASGGAMNALALFIVPSRDGNSYHFTYNGKIFKRTASRVYTLVYTDTQESGQIVGAAEWYDGSGNTYLFWATATRLNVKRIIGTGYSNTEPWADVNTVPVGSWPKTNLSSALWHTMAQVIGTLQIANGNTLAQVGFDQSYTNNSLQLIPGNLVKAILERNRTAIIGSGRDDNSETSAMFMWDGQSQNWNDKELLPIKSINNLIDTEYPLAQIGSNGALYFSDMQSLVPINSFPGGGQCYPDASDNDNGVALFGVFGNGTGKTGVYSYGRKNKNDNPVLNFDYPLAADEIGSVKKVGADILISYRNGSAYGVKRVDTTTKAAVDYQSIDLKPPLQDQRLASFERVQLKTAPLPASCAIEVWRRIDKTGNFAQCNMQGGAVQFTTTGGTEAVFYVGDKGKIFELEVKLIPSGNTGPEVYEGQVFFE